MKSAAPKTYISKRMIDRYSEQRRIAQKIQDRSAPAVNRVFQEDRVQAAADRRPAPEEEKKEEVKIPEKNDRNSSAEEMDSDDLDGDLNLSDGEGAPERR